MATTIEWTEETWNPTTGCDRCSPGCDHCYALTMAGRLKAMGQIKYQNDGDPRTSGPGFALTEHPDTLDQPLRWKTPRTVFVNSMSDLFHPDVSDEFIGQVFDVMLRTSDDPGHVFQVLTKRPQRMRAFVEAWAQWIPGLWLGTSIESDKYVWRARHLRDTPAAVRFLSLEPLLGPLPSLDLTGIDWVIVGGESGPGARPMHPDWARDIRDRCVVEGIPFFFKQHGAWEPIGPLYRQPPDGPLYEEGGDGWDEMDRAHMDAVALEVEDGKEVVQLERNGTIADGYQPNDDRTWLMARVGKKAAGRLLDGRTWDEMPERPQPVPVALTIKPGRG